MSNRIVTAALTAAIAASAEGVAPLWIELMPVGRFQLDDARGAFTLADPAGVIAASFRGDDRLLIDVDHGTEHAAAGGSSAAAGWIVELAARDGSIWARVDWTPRGQALIADRIYRRISPTFLTDDQRRVTRILRAALVNNPALPQLSPVAAGQQETVMDPTELAAALGLDPATDPAKLIPEARAMKGAFDLAHARLTKIAAAAGVPGRVDDVALQTITAAITAPDPARFVPAAAVAALQTEIAALKTAQAARDADQAVAAAKAAGKLAPALEDWARDYATRDVAGFRTWADAAPVIVAAGSLVRVPAARQAGALTAAEAQIAATVGVSPDAYLKTRAALDATAQTKGA